MTTSRNASAWFFGIFVVCAIVGLVAKVVDLSTRAAHPASDAGHAEHKE
jgi:hypothetical protein